MQTTVTVFNSASAISKGVIIGIVVVAVVILVAIAMGAFFLIRLKRRN